MMLDNFLNHWITGKTIRSKVFETWYYDEMLKQWSMERPNVKVCDCKHEEYYLIDGIRYDSLDGANEAMMQNITLRAFLENQ